MTRLPSYFLCHGGGPWPWYEGDTRQKFAELEASLKQVLPSLKETPKALLVISGHWESDVFSVSSNPNPPMLYDYYGFPDWAYQVKYQAPGSPELANRIAELINAAGIECVLDTERGFDHGTFSLAQPMRPEADIPIVQLSIRHDFDIDAHYKIGEAIAPLRKEGVLIIGSGMTYHNLTALGESGKIPSKVFNDWLRNNLSNQPKNKIINALSNIKNAPYSYFAQPKPDHIFPLIVAAGSAQNDECSTQFAQDDFFGNIAITNFKFGN